MIKLNIPLLFVSLIVADPLGGMCYRVILTNKWLNKKSPQNHQEHSDADVKNIETLVKECNSYINNWKSQLEKTIDKINSPDSNATEFAEDCIKTLAVAKHYLKSRLNPSLYPYLKPTLLNLVLSCLKDGNHYLDEWVNRIHALDEEGLALDLLLDRQIDKFQDKLREYECDLNKILFFSFITKSENAAEHRQIHSGTKNELNNANIKKTCSLCNEIIENGDYVFSLLCGHQFHIICMKDCFEEETKLVDNCPTCKQNIWDGVDLKNSVFLTDN